MAVIASPRLSRLYKFFDTYGSERLNGLDRSYFADLNSSEKEEAWSFLMKGHPDSIDNITGLYLLDKTRAIKEFKDTLKSPAPASEYSAERRANEINRLLMLRYVTNAEPDPHFTSLLAEFARSEFEEVRTQFAQSLSLRNVTAGVVAALKGMIFTETERIPLAAAIMALMELHGLTYDVEDPVHRSIYLALRSENPDDKRAAMDRLNTTRPLPFG